VRSRSRVARVLTGVGLAVASTTSLLVAPARPALADGPVRVLIVGDSITAGVNGDYTWRYRLAREFSRQDVPVDFVGSHTSPYVASGFTTATYADPNFDHDHFAVGGALLSSQATLIQREVATQRADVVVLTTGLNDLVHGATVAQTLGYLSSFIDKVRAANPSAKIVVSPVLTIDRTNIPGINPKVIDFDNKAASLVRSKSTAASPVVEAPTRDGWTANPRAGYVQDGIHLTPRGEFFVGNRIAAALETLRVLTHNPLGVPASVPWVRNLKPTLRQSGHDVLITWDTQALTGARIWFRRRWGGWHLITTTQRSQARALTPGATYDFRVQGVRRTMTSTDSAVSTLRAAPIARVRAVRIRGSRISWSKVYGATSYVVKYRRPGSTAWRTRVVKRRSLHVRASVAEVASRDAFSTSSPTLGRRRR
jgi:lysophospholipase L1-like esterase